MIKTRRSSSVYSVYIKDRNQDSSRKIFHLSDKQRTIVSGIGICLSVITFVLQCVAFTTPHWKEISPNTHSLYVDGVDALIRNHVLIYFNSVHRFTRQSYGLFQRCEFLLSNSTKFINEQEKYLSASLYKQQKACTKNFVTSYEDQQFDECHSLQYYRFCSKTSGKVFNVNNDYLRPTFDVSVNSRRNIDSTFSCGCQYPTYIKACHILGIFALIFLFLTTLLFGVFPFLETRYARLTVKCFAVLSSILSMLFIIINISVVLSHLEYESTEYLLAIERHYRAAEIYKLSEDTKVAIGRFMLSINIEIGYSTIIAWIAFFLSIVDGIFIMLTCKVTSETHDIAHRFSAISSNPSRQDTSIETADYQTTTAPPMDTSSNSDSQLLSVPPSLSPSPLKIRITESEEQSKPRSYFPPSCLKRNSPCRVNFNDEV